MSFFTSDSFIVTGLTAQDSGCELLSFPSSSLSVYPLARTPNFGPSW
jgi:hypothetical protein